VLKHSRTGFTRTPPSYLATHTRHDVQDLAQSSENVESSSTVSFEEVYSWASQLSSESRRVNWISYGYVWPDAVSRVLRQLEIMQGGIIGLVGLQGVGKSSALLAILTAKLIERKKEQRKPSKQAETDHKAEDDSGIIMFKWRRQSELFTSLLDGTHEIAHPFRIEYAEMLMKQVEADYPRLSNILPKGRPRDLNIDWAEKKVGKAISKKLRQPAWLEMLRKKKIILIDTPDYSKTDRRLMAKDLDEIYWLWNYLVNRTGAKPNLVLTIQKEMFRDHFFFDKMQKIELQPLTPQQMLEAYMKRFKTTQPFTEEALITLAQMSRGIFRRYLKDITSTLEHWQAQSTPHEPITKEIVKAAVTPQRLVEDMDLELSELFPKQSDLKLQAIRLLLNLSESGPRRQDQLAEELNLEPYTITRLLQKLELHRYITRRREGNDKIVTITKT